MARSFSFKVLLLKSPQEAFFVWEGPPVLNRMSANALLKAVIAAMAAVVMILLANSAWQSWQKLAAVGRILTVADASANAFKAMHNLRTDRASTFRTLNGEGTIEPDI